MRKCLRISQSFRFGRKIYLPEIIDYFDGMVAAWSISASRNAELVNHTLDKYHDTMKKEKPLIHSNHGAYY